MDDKNNNAPVGSGIRERERAHHDHWASEIDVTAIRVERYFDASTCPENRYILDRIGRVDGKRVLDLGCGAGENSVFFATRGALCTAADVSPGMVKTALALAERYGVRIDGHIMDATAIDFPDQTFDIVYASNILHHTSPEHVLREMHRVLKPGGKACFWDPLKHNPVINIYRRIASDVRSRDEKPLDIRIVRSVQNLFSHVEYDTFWLCTLWIFIRFYLIERVDPNKERYWKKIVYEEPRLRSLYLRLEKIDRHLKKLSCLKRYGWNIAVVATK